MSNFQQDKEVDLSHYMDKTKASSPSPISTSSTKKLRVPRRVIIMVAILVVLIVIQAVIIITNQPPKPKGKSTPKSGLIHQSLS